MDLLKKKLIRCRDNVRSDLRLLGMKRIHKHMTILLIILVTSGTFIGAPFLNTDDNASSNSSYDFDGLASTQIRRMLFGIFYENIGQVDSDIQFLGRVADVFVGFGKNTIVIDSASDDSRIILSFITRHDAIPYGDDETQSKTSYFQGTDLRFIGVRGFSSVVYYEVWSGINIRCQATAMGIVIRFEIEPNSNPSDIEIKVSKQEHLALTKESILLTSKQTSIVLDELKAFQNQNQLSVCFRDMGYDSFGIDTDRIDLSSPAFVESVLHSSTLGGSDFDIPFSVAVDQEENVYVTGCTFSSDFPVETALDESFNGESDCFVLKIDTSTNSIAFSTFIGGKKGDVSTTIALDSEGDIYIAGRTQSLDFPVVAGYDMTFNGGLSDCFIAKISNDGSNLVYSTYFGGSANDYAQSIIVDSKGSVYVAGYTSSSNLPTANGYCQVYNGGFSDTFVIKLTANGRGLFYSTYMGGSASDFAVSIDIDNSGCAFVAGYTYSADFPIVNAVDYTYNGCRDSIIYKLNNDGSRLLFSTFLGGQWIDQAEYVAVDRQGNVIIAGTTYSEDFPVLNAYDATHNGESDCFISMINLTGNSLLLSTYLGGSGNDFGLRASLDSEGYLYITGTTDSLDFPTEGEINVVTDGTLRTFVTKFDISLTSLLYSKLLDEFNDDYIKSLAIDSQGTAYLTGYNTLSIARTTLFDTFDTFSTQIFLLKSVDIGDSDSDGLADYLENELQLDRFNADTDFDNLNDALELYYLGTNPRSNDTDFDNLGDGFEVNIYHTNPLQSDSDSDGLNDELEVIFLGTDANEQDSDGDALDDFEEVNYYGTNPVNADTDNDTLSDSEEILVFGTNPLLNDSDIDLMPDSWEIQFGLNPIVNDAYADMDFDGLLNIEEYFFDTFPNCSDSDNDGLNDTSEIQIYNSNPRNNDTDFDGLSDYAEIFFYGTNATNSDSDGDIIPDYWEIQHGLNANSNDSIDDFDSDGVSNILEFLNGADPNSNDTDNDKINDFAEINTFRTYPNNTDSDNDTLDDYEEIFLYLTNPLNNDTDFDKLADAVEVSVYFTNPLSNDSDSDYMYDEWEVRYSLNPLINDTNDDPDLDGLNNFAEFLNGTNPQSNDTDEDTLNDFEELYILHTNPSNNDTDGDNLEDAFEILIQNTDPLNNDTDSDSMPDGWEAEFGLNPNVNDAFADFDLDGLLNLYEYEYGANPCQNDSDLDGFSDFYEVYILGTSPNNTDTEFDGMPDSWEVFFDLNAVYNDAFEDADADGLPNIFEYKNKANPRVADTDSDGLTDKEEVQIFHTKPYTDDSDNDSINDFAEVKEYHTNPNANDTDSDSLPDNWEIRYKTNPSRHDSNEDQDADTLTNFEEFILRTNPLLDDTDSDSLSDFDEVRVYMTNPNCSDSDLDGLDDYQEITKYHTNPLMSDTDFDMLPDAWEITYGLDPNHSDSDEDSDNDSVTNLEEYYSGSNPFLVDSDSDGLSDSSEINTHRTDPAKADTDNDALTDARELRYGTDPLYFDSDFDGVLDGSEVDHYFTNPLSIDSDGDTMIDGWEIRYGLNPLYDDSRNDIDSDGLSNSIEYSLMSNPLLTDSDNDQLDDLWEYLHGTNLINIDSDSDGLGDGWEVLYGFNPLLFDSSGDSDSDGLSNLEEYQYRSSPLNSDSDHDDLSDFLEAHVYNTNLMSNDSDSDSLLDAYEIVILGTNPLSPDSDQDGLPDSWELHYGLNATLNDADFDGDSDEFTNLMEYNHGTDPNNADTDSDSLNDYTEVYIFDTLPCSADSDNDNLTDFYEVFISATNPRLPDSDFDELTDSLEIQIGTNPNLVDTDFDGISDYWEYTNGFNPNDPVVPFQEFLSLNYILIFLLVSITVGLIVVSLFRRKQFPNLNYRSKLRKGDT